jgi:hypothetical protein
MHWGPAALPKIDVDGSFGQPPSNIGTGFLFALTTAAGFGSVFCPLNRLESICEGGTGRSVAVTGLKQIHPDE